MKEEYFVVQVFIVSILLFKYQLLVFLHLWTFISLRLPQSNTFKLSANLDVFNLLNCLTFRFLRVPVSLLGSC